MGERVADDASSSEWSERHEKASSRYERTFGPLLRDLARAGFAAHSIEELRERYSSLPATAVEILLPALGRIDDRGKLLILQTLQKAATPFDGRPLAACYDETTDQLVKDNVINTIAWAKAKPHSIENWLESLDPKTKTTLKALWNLI